MSYEPDNKIASSKRKLGYASVMLLFYGIASLIVFFVVEDEQVTEEADVLMWTKWLSGKAC